MMIAAIELENFKGVASRQRVDLAPLTLLFGANSAGKSTVLQALLYLNELLERGNADVDRTELGGGVVKLGGFARLVHRHDLARAMVLRAEFATPGRLERFGRDTTDFPFPDLDDGVESAWMELTVRHRTEPTFRGALIERAAIGMGSDSEPLVWLEVGASLRGGEPLNVRVNLGHPWIAEQGREWASAWQEVAIPEEVLERAREVQVERGVDSGLWDMSGLRDGRALPVFAVSRSRLSAVPPLNEPLRVIPFGDVDTPERATAIAHIRTFLEMVILGTGAQLLSSLKDAVYLGPLRAVPPRGFLYERTGRIANWADGLAAWDLLLSDRLGLVERTNAWLERLGVGCKLVVQEFFHRSASAEEVSDGHVDQTVRRLLLDTGPGSLVLPSEVGAGISQVLPVIVAALEGRGRLTLVEQPELHVHPAIQVGLGDLFIEAVTREGPRRPMIVETHSEHLLLRLLRRIRETTESELPAGATPFTPDRLSVLYVERVPEGVRIRKLRVNGEGEFIDRWPHGFFAERMQELI